LRQDDRRDLPRDAVAVWQPAAAVDCAAFGQPVPKPVDFRLIGDEREFDHQHARALPAGLSVTFFCTWSMREAGSSET